MCDTHLSLLHSPLLTQERPNRELQFTINTAVKQAIAESGASETEQAAMWARWLRKDTEEA